MTDAIRDEATGGEIIIYQSADGLTRVNVQMQGETVWLSQQQLAELYGTSKQNIGQHIKNILAEEELDNSVVKKFFTTAADGKKYNVEHYNLDMIISLGYRINSKRLRSARRCRKEL